jgi:site-specific DNA-methyltransferase (adenine-specific)
MQRGSFSHSAEFLIHGTNGPTDRDYDGAQQNVFACGVVDGDLKEHIAEKPEPVLRWIMKVAPPGGLILDPFCGTGASLRAAKDSDRPAIGIEIEEKYCEIAAKRLSQEVLAFGETSPEQTDRGQGPDQPLLVRGDT